MEHLSPSSSDSGNFELVHDGYERILFRSSTTLQAGPKQTLIPRYFAASDIAKAVKRASRRAIHIKYKKGEK